MAFAVAIVVGWFSIAGIITIYAGAPLFAALVMGIVIECTKLVSLSWLYRNWKSSGLLLRIPLVVISFIIMVITNIGVFGYLSKGHLEQGAATIDHSAKVEQINRQITQEQSRITDSEKIIAQMDGAVNSLIGKDQANRSLSVRKSQAGQRKQLRDEITASQKQIDTWNAEKFTLEAEVRKVEHEIGPIKYIAEVFIQSDDKKAVDTAVQLFTLLIVLVLDPAAVMLLLAANHSLSKTNNENEEKEEKSQDPVVEPATGFSNTESANKQADITNELLTPGPLSELPNSVADISTKQDTETPLPVRGSSLNEKETTLATEDGDFYPDIIEQKGSETGNEDGYSEIEEYRLDLDNQRASTAPDISLEIQNEPIHEVLAQQQESLNEEEDTILEKFGNAGSFTHQTPPTAFILQPSITRVQIGEQTFGSHRPAAAPELPEEHQITSKGNTDPLSGGQPWHWSHHRDGIPAPRKNKEIKTLSWLKTFGKE